MTSQPRLLIVAGGTRTTASTRHRLWNYRPFLEKDGVPLDWIEYGGGRVEGILRAAALRAGFLADLVTRPGAADVVLVQKVLPPLSLVRRWKRAGKRVVYDFDDALWHRWPHGDTENRWRKRKARFDAMLEVADVVIAGSPPLAEYARERAGLIEVMYPSLRRERFAEPAAAGSAPSSRPVGEGGRADEVVVGWIGNDQSQVYLRELEPVLLDVFAAHPEASLAVCSSKPPELHPDLVSRMRFLPWSETGEVEAARSFDVAISPLDPAPWSRARGGRVSVLLSMASNVAVVASPGGGLEELVEGREAILFADDDDAWRDRLARAIGDAPLRTDTAAAARGIIESRVFADVQYPVFRRILLGD